MSSGRGMHEPIVPGEVLAEENEVLFEVVKHQVIATITKGGKDLPLTAGFKVAADSLATDPDDAVQFEYQGRVYFASSSPVEGEGSDSWRIDRASDHLDVGDILAAQQVLDRSRPL